MDDVDSRLENQSSKKALMKAVLRWEMLARQQFECSDRTEDRTGKRVMDHGATVYFNCAQEIRRYLADL